MGDQLATLDDKISDLIYIMSKKSQNYLDRVFEFAAFEMQRKFNKRLESLIGITFLVCRLILIEFGKDPKKIGINDNIQYLERNDIVQSEMRAFQENV